MSACTFFGHRDCPSSVKTKLREELINLIEKHGIPEGYQKHRKNIENIENQQNLEPFLSANPADFSYFSFLGVWIPHEFHTNSTR